MNPVCVAVCDDQPQMVDLLSGIIQTICDKKKEQWVIRKYLRASDLLHDINNVTLVFLDLSMPEMDGIEAAERIREINPDCAIVISTAEKHRFKEGYRVRAIRFVTKPFDETEIQEALFAALKEKPGNDLIAVYKDRIPYNIRQRDICYIRSFNGYLELYTIDGEVFRKEASLVEIEPVLDARLFVRTHRAYIVNLARITSLMPRQIMMGNMKVPVSTRLYSSVVSKHASYEWEYRK